MAVVYGSSIRLPYEYQHCVAAENPGCMGIAALLRQLLPVCVQAHFMGQTQRLSPIDTYFMIDCINGGSVPPSAPSPPDPIPDPIPFDPPAQFRPEP